MTVEQIIEKKIAKLEEQGFRDVVLADAPYLSKYNPPTYQPFGVAQTAERGMMLVSRNLLGWSGEGYAHVRMDLQMAPRTVREAAEDFLSVMRGQGRI